MFKDHIESLGGEVDLSRPSVRGLAHLLRNLPANFDFNFCDCNNCAMGLAQKTWNSKARYAPTGDQITNMLGISNHLASELFYSRIPERRTAIAIAEDLEALLV